MGQGRASLASQLPSQSKPTFPGSSCMQVQADVWKEVILEKLGCSKDGASVPFVCMSPSRFLLDSCPCYLVVCYVSHPALLSEGKIEQSNSAQIKDSGGNHTEGSLAPFGDFE